MHHSIRRLRSIILILSFVFLGILTVRNYHFIIRQIHAIPGDLNLGTSTETVIVKSDIEYQESINFGAKPSPLLTPPETQEAGIYSELDEKGYINVNMADVFGNSTVIGVTPAFGNFLIKVHKGRVQATGATFGCTTCTGQGEEVLNSDDTGALNIYGSMNHTGGNYIFDSTGNVGLSSTSPGTKLDVVGAVRTNNQFISTLATGTSPFSVASTTVVTNLNADTLDSYNSTTLPYVNNVTDTTLTRTGAGPYTLGLNLGNANTWSAAQTFSANTNFPSGIWNTSGNVGIGSTSPGSRLDISGGNIKLNGNYISYDGTSAGIYIDNSNQLQITNNAYVSGTNGFCVGGTCANKLYYNSTMLSLMSGNTVSLSIASNGNVGIGTTTTTNGKLNVVNSAGPAVYASGSTYDFYGASGNASYFAGNVGIGTTAPIEKLNVTGNASASGNMTIGYNSALRSQYGPLSLAYKSGLNTWSTGLTLDDITGYAGIGSTAPETKLDLNGSFKLNNNMYMMSGHAIFSNKEDVLSVNKNVGSDGSLTYGALTNPTQVRSHHTAVYHNGKMYVWGGLDGSNQLNTLDIYNFVTGVWTTGAAGGTARSGHTATVYNDKIYYWGGYNGSTKINTLNIYDIAANSWSTGTAGGTARAYHSSVFYNGKIYFWGGQNASNVYINTVDIYDIAANTWSTGTAGGTARGFASAALYGKKMYIYGGYNGSTYYDTVDIYDIAAGSWSTGTAGIARKGTVGVTHNGKWYVWGGSNSGGNLTNMQYYDFSANTWTAATAGGTGRRDLAGVLYKGIIYYIGGIETNTSNRFDYCDLNYNQSILTLQENGVDILNFTTNSSLYTSSGNFNIMGDLEVNGNISLGSTIGRKIFLYKYGSTNYAGISTEASGGITFITGTTSPAERVRITSNGNVGIGTTAPAGPLSVQWDVNDGAADMYLRNTNALGSASTDITLGNNVQADAAVISMHSSGHSYGANDLVIYNKLPAPLRLGTDYGERMRIDAGGNVGIGTTLPGGPLSVVWNRNSYSTDVFLRNTNSQNYASTELTFGNDVASDGAALSLHSSNNQYGSNVFNAWNRLSGAFTFGTNNTERARIDAGGNVGIGTTVPESKFHVFGGTLGATAGNQVAVATFKGATGNEDRLNFFLNRNSSTDGWEYASWRMQRRVDSTNMGYIAFGHYNADPITFGDGSSEFVRITQVGYMGIGTTAPGYQLDVWTTGIRGNGTYVNRASHSSLKDRFNDTEVLDKIINLNIKEWQYKDSVASQNKDYSRHLYPFADDFYKAFHLGLSERQIASDDIGGVALKGIQELYAKFNVITEPISHVNTTSLSVSENKQEYIVKDIYTNKIYKQISTFSESFIAKITAGIIHVKKLLIDGVDVLKKIQELEKRIESQQLQIDRLQKQLEDLHSRQNP